jgi:hypothetical protein
MAPSRHAPGQQEFQLIEVQRLSTIEERLHGEFRSGTSRGTHPFPEHCDTHT